ncbi:hypothetical protein G419_20785 [Rhodococcus triatomae BKS 15-14]|nr:hypothetical protein G419_20785 [Rhodococcus triatomae BKS 15-14]
MATGNITLIAPTLDITETGQEEIVDGVRMIFQMAPGTEAPAEFLVYFPEHKALCSAEDAMHTMHNLLTLRGALVRDPHAWSNYLPETIDMFGGETEVVFALHHWPTWGNERVVQFLSAQRDLYAYLRDQTLRLINKGWTGIEIAEELPLPPVPRKSLARPRLLRLGKPQHQSHLSALRGLYDGNPAHLWQHPPGSRASATSSSAVARTSWWPRPANHSTRAISDGPRRSSVTSCSPSPTTNRHGRCFGTFENQR